MLRKCDIEKVTLSEVALHCYRDEGERNFTEFTIVQQLLSSNGITGNCCHPIGLKGIY